MVKLDISDTQSTDAKPAAAESETVKPASGEEAKRSEGPGAAPAAAAEKESNAALYWKVFVLAVRDIWTRFIAFLTNFDKVMTGCMI